MPEQSPSWSWFIFAAIFGVGMAVVAVFHLDGRALVKRWALLRKRSWRPTAREQPSSSLQTSTECPGGPFIERSASTPPRSCAGRAIPHHWSRTSGTRRIMGVASGGHDSGSDREARGHQPPARSRRVQALAVRRMTGRTMPVQAQLSSCPFSPRPHLFGAAMQGGPWPLGWHEPRLRVAVLPNERGRVSILRSPDAESGRRRWNRLPGRLRMARYGERP